MRLLIDAWFMRKRLILPLLERRVRIIGQVRRDTALFLPPEAEPKRRGRKRKYGRRIDGGWSRARLILATETDLSAKEVIEIYAERWGIEPLFHNLKRWWGVTNLWQQSKEALALWMQIRCMAFALTQWLALKRWASFPLMAIAPWRKGAIITAGLFGQWMRIQFIGLRVRGAYDQKSENFVMPLTGQDQRLPC